jgi:hypothetical protein
VPGFIRKIQGDVQELHVEVTHHEGMSSVWAFIHHELTPDRRALLASIVEKAIFEAVKEFSA